MSPGPLGMAVSRTAVSVNFVHTRAFRREETTGRRIRIQKRSSKRETEWGRGAKRDEGLASLVGNGGILHVVAVLWPRRELHYSTEV